MWYDSYRSKWPCALSSWNFIKRAAVCWKHFLYECWGSVSVWFMISCRCSKCCYLFVSTWICVKSLYGESHKSLHAAYNCWSFFQIFFLNFLCQIQNQGNQEKSFYLICFELKQRIEDFMFSLSKSNCKLMWTSQLPSPRRRSGSSNDSVPWSSACVNHPDCSSL